MACVIYATQYNGAGYFWKTQFTWNRLSIVCEDTQAKGAKQQTKAVTFQVVCVKNKIVSLEAKLKSFQIVLYY